MNRTEKQDAVTRATSWLERHIMTDRQSRSWHFYKPNKGSVYAYSLTWTPGSLFLAGDLGELTLTHYNALHDLESGLSWAASSDADYLLGKSDRKRVFDRQGTIDYIVQCAMEPESRLPKVLADHIHIGNAWGASLKRLLQRELFRVFEEFGGERAGAWIYDLGYFDDWYGSADWTTHDLTQIVAIRRGAAMALAGLPEKAAAA